MSTTTAVQISNDIKFTTNGTLFECMRFSAIPDQPGLTLSENISLNSAKTPEENSHLVTKEYVDTQISNNIQGLDVKDSVRFASTGYVVLNSVSNNDSNLDLGSKILEAGDRVLLKDQDSSSENGIYVWDSGSLSRSSDFDSTSDISKGAYAFVYDGIANKGAAYAVTTLGSDQGGAFSLDEFNAGITWSVISNSTSGASNASNITTGLLDASRIHLGDDVNVGLTVNAGALRVKDGGINGVHIADSTITEQKLATDSITAIKILDGTITGGKIVHATITNDHLLKSSMIIGGVDITLGVDIDNPAFNLSNASDYNFSNLVGTLSNADIGFGTITQDKLAGSIPNSKIEDKTIEAGKIKDGTIINLNLKDGEISHDKLAGFIPNSKIADKTIQGGKIKDDTIESRHLKDDSVTNDQIQDNTITSVKFANSTIEGGKIKDDTIENSHLKDDSVTKDKILNSTITSDKFVDGTITGGKIANNTITNDHLVDETITGGKIVNTTITNDHLAGSISNDKLSLIDTAGKVANSATTATDAATSSAIVARDATGGFSAASINVSGTITAQTVSTTSDPQLKKDMTVLNDCIQKIDMINGYSFTWKDDTRDPGMQYGLNADEVEEMNSDLIKIGTQGYKSVNYNGVLAVMLGAIKELKAEVAILKEKCSC